jgi:D-alanyl-D-alanine carboxypeptidase
LFAPINKGDIVGSMEIVIPGRKNIEINLLAGENINKVNFFSGFIKSFDYFLYKDE